MSRSVEHHAETDHQGRKKTFHNVLPGHVHRVEAHATTSTRHQLPESKVSLTPGYAGGRMAGPAQRISVSTIALGATPLRKAKTTDPTGTRTRR